MNNSNIYRFNGKDPFDNWTVKDGELYGYYPRNSLVNILSKQAGVTIVDNVLVIPESVTSIKGSCFRNNKHWAIYIPSSVKKISSDAFKDTTALLVVDKNSYAEKYLKRKGLRYVICKQETNNQSEGGSNQTSKQNAF